MQRKLYPKKLKQSNNNCPECGFHISHHHSFESVLAGKFDNAANGGYSAYRSTPLRQSTLESDVLVPAAQSAIWAFVSILPAIPVSIWLRYEWYFPVTVAGFSLLASWFRSQRKSEASLCTIEEFTYSPNEIAPPQIAPLPNGQSIKLDITERPGKTNFSIKFVDLPPSISQEKFLEFCKSVVSGKSISRKNYTPERVLLSRDQYDGLLEKLVASGIVSPSANGKNGLTSGGRRAIARFVSETQNAS